MRSHLTRQVFRRLILDEGVISLRCHKWCARPQQSRITAQPTLIGRRTFFGLSSKTRELRDADLDPGLQKMMELSLLTRVNTRPPPVSELIKAFNAFFRARQKTKEPLKETQAKHAFRTFEHIQQISKHDGEGEGLDSGLGLGLEDLEIARDSLIFMPDDGVGTHNKFARALFNEIKRRREQDHSIGLPVSPKDVLQLVMVLTQTGDAMEARHMAAHHWESNKGKTGKRLWAQVLKGFAAEGNESALLRTMSLMSKAGIAFDTKLHQIITVYFARRDDVKSTKMWYAQPIIEGGRPTHHTNCHVLKFCIRNHELEWGQSIIQSTLEGTPSKKTWDLIFQWAVAHGKGVDEIGRMMDVMVRRNVEDDRVQPDIESINDLIEMANVRTDPYTAERFVALGQQRGMEPNARTYMLQLEYRIQAGDLDGARVAYDALQGQEITSGDDIPVVTRFVRALCESRDPPYEIIQTIVDDLSERKVRLDSSTLSVLCRMHLQRDELYEVYDILQAHVFHYSAAQRGEVVKTLVDCCFDRENSSARAWDAYTVVRKIFAETSLATRTRLMKEFFRRGRSDLAVHAFGHMRQNLRRDGRPNIGTYTQCLTGIARLHDHDGLKVVHNMLKLDSSIEPNTRLYNALMLAYTSANMPYRSLEFWQDILRSREGPSYASLVIALQACETVQADEQPAMEIWDRLKGMKVPVTEDVAAAYVGALARRWPSEEVMKVIDSLEADVVVKPGLLTIGTFYNATPNQEQRDVVKAWARENYQDAWTALEQVGQRTEEGMETGMFDINRDVDP